MWQGHLKNVGTLRSEMLICLLFLNRTIKTLQVHRLSLTNIMSVFIFQPDNFVSHCVHYGSASFVVVCGTYPSPFDP